MTRQELFNFVAKALRTQGKPSYVGGVGITTISCLYRGPNGLKCAAGHLIPDEEYDNTFERRTIKGLIESEVLGSQTMLAIGNEWRFVNELQMAHDNAIHQKETAAEWLTQWLNAMTVLAQDNELDDAALTEPL